MLFGFLGLETEGMLLGLLNNRLDDEAPLGDIELGCSTSIPVVVSISRGGVEFGEAAPKESGEVSIFKGFNSGKLPPRGIEFGEPASEAWVVLGVKIVGVGWVGGADCWEELLR